MRNCTSITDQNIVLFWKAFGRVKQDYMQACISQTTMVGQQAIWPQTSNKPVRQIRHPVALAPVTTDP